MKFSQYMSFYKRKKNKKKFYKTVARNLVPGLFVFTKN